MCKVRVHIFLTALHLVQLLHLEQILKMKYKRNLASCFIQELVLVGSLIRSLEDVPVQSLKSSHLLLAQAAQTLFVIYIRDSIALRLNRLRECMKMVRKSL